MRKTIKFFLIVFVLLSLIVTVEAHSGSTDEDGGHYNHSTGEYHYHHGKPAHQHKYDKCPYKNDWIVGVAAIAIPVGIVIWIKRRK